MQQFWIPTANKSVIVGQKKERVLLGLNTGRDRRPNGADIVAQVRRARGFYAGKNFVVCHK